VTFVTCHHVSFFGHFEPIAKFSKFSFLSLYNKTQIKTGVVSLLWLAGLESPYYQCLYLTYYLVQNISSDHISSRGQITSFGQVAKMINMPWLGRPFPLLFMKIPTKTVKALKRLQIWWQKNEKNPKKIFKILRKNK